MYPGEYLITTTNPVTNESVNNTVVVKPVIGDNSDLTMYYKNGSAYSVTALDTEGNAVPGATVTFNINGVLYDVVADKNGTASLPINLYPGDYIITAVMVVVWYLIMLMFYHILLMLRILLCINLMVLLTL